MGARPPASAKDVFLDALELPEGEREAFVAGACGADASLVVRVRALLAAHREADTRLGKPPDAWRAPLPVALPDALRASLPGELPDAWRASLPVDLQGGTPVADARRPGQDLALGDMIGPYRLVSELGQGGFGTVYRAEQQKPVRREVALKVVKLGMDSRAVIARFEVERQALALMDHPGIAKVLDAGATEGGRPFFVMELVEGRPITEYCAEHELSLRARLLLFVTLCQAVQHAHAKGVIHRDLKPGNVLVTEVDGRPVPKVIDFGIAKATAQPLTEASLVTRHGHVVGTPAFMSPEQVASAADVDIRSDVYSLGVLLYELVAGQAPFDFEQVGFAELQRLILEVDPVRPSQRSRAATKALASRRSTSRATTGTSTGSTTRTTATTTRTTTGFTVPADLDWIVLRCLEKERTRRYPTAAALASDVERFLDSRPVEAAPPSTLYRVRKLVRRHRAASVAVLAVLAALVGGAALAMSGLLEARAANAALGSALQRAVDEAARAQSAETLAAERAERAARAEATAGEQAVAARAAEARAAERATEADRQAAIAREVLAFLNRDLLGAVEPSARPGRGRGVLVREVLDLAARRLEQQALAGGRFATEPLVEAAVRASVGGAYAALGLPEAARPHLERALELRREHQGPSDVQTLLAARDLGDVLRQLGELEPAAELLALTVAALRESVGPAAPPTLGALRLQGLVLMDQGRLDEAERVLEQARGLAEQSLGADSADVLDAESCLALLDVLLGRAEQAEARFRRDVERRAATLGAEDPRTLVAVVNLANFLRGAGQLDEAEQLYEQVGEALGRVLGPDHPDTLTALHGRGRLTLAQGRFEEAAALLADVLARARRVLGKDHAETLDIQGALGRALELLGRLAEAEELSAEAHALALATFGPHHLQTLQRAKELCSIYYEQRRLDDAEPLLRAVLAAEREQLGPGHPRVVASQMNLAMVELERGEPGRAEDLFREAWLDSRLAAGPDALQTIAALSNLSAFLVEVGRHAEAEELAAEAVQRTRRALPDDGGELATQLIRLGAALLGQERHPEAEAALLEARAILREQFDPAFLRNLEVLEKLAYLYESWGRPEEAAAYDAELAAIRAAGEERR